MVALTEYRDRFPILAHTRYLINHSLGAMPATAATRLAAYAETWNTRGARAWNEGWWEIARTVGDQVGRIVGAPAGSTVMHQNVTVAQAVVLSCLDFDGPRRRIVYTQDEFPSVRYLQQAQSRRGAEVVVVSGIEELAAALDERTLLVPLSHVLFRTGQIQDVVPVLERAREVGALVLLDAYQSAGTVPLDVAALGVDFAVGGSVKWLCGGPGAGWLYVRPDLAERLSPTLVGWQAHARPFAFESELQLADGAARFLTGTPNVPALYAATAGYDLIEEADVERIRANSMRQTALLARLLESAGFELTGPLDPAHRGGTVTVRTPEFEAVHRELDARDVICDFRPDVGLRLGPHFFTTDDEISSSVAEITDIVQTGAYEKHLEPLAAGGLHAPS